MAGSARSPAAKHAYRMFAPSRGATARCPGSPGADEFDESDVWGSFSVAGVDSSPAELGARGRPIPSARAGRKAPMDRAAAGAAAGSLPVNIPDWQKILGVEYRDHQAAAAEWELHGDGDDDYEYGKVAGGVGGVVIPPHELAWRGRAASLSVHEGIGRTLKGRDLSRVRDAVWKKTGFED
ncbi:hypothetical protein E2562_038396 [Oryza meyeriana var. granulata]|uniref:Senescence regulator n=1 Tax=Oryza meyeriana var. granulata TaxID=110450 RepID=A0A6G1C2I9_9ORYZ|nr:hypothetical protein E2562_038396 [Oryza meyeriana var. granulata]